jgi:SAM-dependent methyltransferase
VQRSKGPRQPSRRKSEETELRATVATAPEPSSDDTRLAAQAYDDFPYEGYSFPLTHPERLATIAALFGMQPPPVATARVLELGCGTGGNLIPMAHAIPGAAFTGYDLSGVQVERARATIGALELRNIMVEQRNILDVGRSGQFDYIICHGVYSWVPENVQERILAVCRESLSENGVALVSYNTYPGWHMRDSVREMMRYDARQFGDAKLQVAQSRALLDFLVKSVDSEKTPYGMHLAGELKLLSSCDDYYIAHEHLERWNTPVYFHQFAERLAQHDLQYLGESEFSTMVVKNLAAPVAETLSRGIRDVLRMEQYMDFIRNRTFRSTLLCHKERQLDRNITGDRVKPLLVAARMELMDATTDLQTVKQEAFNAANGAQFQTSAPLTRAALRVLASAWPRAVPFAALAADALRLIGSPEPAASPAAESQLGNDLLQLYAANAIELHSMPSS